jgi:hypothetical protein
MKNVPNETLKAYEEWHKQPPRGLKEIDLDLNNDDVWVEIGKLVKIDYWSDKWDRNDSAIYTHKSSKPGIYRHPTANAILICGGKFEISNRGLIR